MKNHVMFSDCYGSISLPYTISMKPMVIMRIVLAFKMYLLYFFVNASLISPNRSINTQVPSPKMNMVSAPFNEVPAEAATNHIDDSIPQGITAVSKPIINGVPLKPQGDVSPGRNFRRSGTPHI